MDRGTPSQKVLGSDPNFPIPEQDALTKPYLLLSDLYLKDHCVSLCIKASLKE